MKNINITILLLMIVGFDLSARRQIQIYHGSQIPNHNGLPIYLADQPDVYYDDVEQEIIIDGTGEATYYYVDIVSLSTLDTVLSTSVNGTYDTIEVSSLPDDNYKIVITSSLENVFIGYFTNY